MKPSDQYIRHFQAFDTECEIRIPRACVPRGLDSAKALDVIEAACQRYEKLFSAFIPESDIGRINTAGGQAVRVDDETIELLEGALAFCKKYGDLFDITIGGAARLWDFHTNSHRKASEQASREAAAHVGWRGVHLDRAARTVQLADARTQLDLGGAAKGFIADKLAIELREMGIAGAIVDLGGNIYVLGQHPDGRPWKVCIEDPDDERNSFATVDAVDASVVTSGVTNRSFTEDGLLLHHILNPKTGRPVETDLVCASVISSNSFAADCLATTLVAAGADRAVQIAREEGIKVVLLNTRDEVYRN